MLPINSTDYLSNFIDYQIPRSEKRKVIDTYQSSCSSTDYDKLGDPAASPSKKLRFANDRNSIEKEAIIMHVFEKTTKFLNSCFHVIGQKNLQFEIGKTNAQGPSAKKLVIRVGRKNFTEAMHAVHSSALPVLHAYPLKEWQDWKEEGGSKPQGFLYLHKSYFDFTENATNTLPKKINDIDSLIEGHSRNPKSFRYACIEIINQVAHEDIKLTEALPLFLKKYEEVIQEHLSTFIPPLNPKDQKQERLIRHFLESVLDLQSRYSTKPFVLYDRLLHFASTDLFTPDHRAEFYKRKCLAMQQIAGLESKIFHALSPVRQRLLKGVKKSPHRFSLAFKATALSLAQEKNKRLIRKLFCASEEELKADSNEAMDFIAQRQTSSTFNHFPEKIEEFQSKKQEVIAAYQAEQLAFFMREAKMTKETLFEAYQAYDDEVSVDILEKILEAKIPMSERIMGNISEIFETHKSFFEIDSCEEEQSAVGESQTEAQSEVTRVGAEEVEI